MDILWEFENTAITHDLQTAKHKRKKHKWHARRLNNTPWLKFCIFALGIPLSACNLAAYGELGRSQLIYRRQTCMIKYWLSLHNWTTPTLLVDSLQIVEMEGNSTWLARSQEGTTTHRIYQYLAKQTLLTKEKHTGGSRRDYMTNMYSTGEVP